MAKLVLVQKGPWTKIYCKKISGPDETGLRTNYCKSILVHVVRQCTTIHSITE